MALMAGEVDAVADVGAILPEQAEEVRRYPGIGTMINGRGDFQA